MDIISHGLWGSIAFGRKNKRQFWEAFAFGIVPDLVAFGPYFVLAFFGLVPRPGFYSSAHPPPFEIPQFVHMLYSVSHSLIAFTVIFGIVWLVLKKPRLTMLAWLFHIVLDIPTHDLAFFPTPFLWPLSRFEVNGVSWAHPAVLVPDIILLAALYTYFFFIRKKLFYHG